MKSTWLITQGPPPCPAQHRFIGRSSRPSSWNRPSNSSAPAPLLPTIVNALSWPCSFTSNPTSPTSPLVPAFNFTPTPFAAGDSAGLKSSSPWMTNPVGDANRPFPPLDHAIVKAMACELVAQTESPLSRQSLGDLAKRATGELGKKISRKTIKRILDEDTIKPWRYEHWIFPRAADFFPK